MNNSPQKFHDMMDQLETLEVKAEVFNPMLIEEKGGRKL